MSSHYIPLSWLREQWRVIKPMSNGTAYDLWLATIQIEINRLELEKLVNFNLPDTVAETMADVLERRKRALWDGMYLWSGNSDKKVWFQMELKRIEEALKWLKGVTGESL